MELREWATRILGGDTLEEKLLTPQKLTDHEPGTAIFWNEPARPLSLKFRPHSRKNKLPPLHEHKDQDKRAICLHRFAGHELLAVEIMAHALLAFPEAPKHFRRGVANTLIEEQEHVHLYMKRLEELGLKFGDLPLHRHFWAYTRHLRTPEQYVSVMSLTFEMANLDFAPMYGTSFKKHGDMESAALMERILSDEIAHVSFGYHWLKKLKRENQTDWQAWTSSLPEMLPKERARGRHFQEEPRKKAGIPDLWIENLKIIRQ